MNTNATATPTQPLPAPAAPTFATAFRFWLKLGCISFGGPAGQIAIMQRELVDERRWISQARFNHALNYCMLLPGPEAQQLATYIGWLMHRSLGGIVAGGLFVLPSLLLLIALSALYLSFGDLPLAKALLWGIQCAVAALVVQALHRLGSRTLGRPSAKPVHWALALGSFVAIAGLGVGFPWIVAAGALTGWLAAKRWPDQFAAGAHAAAAGQAHAPAFIDDDSPTPAHARHSRGKAFTVLGIGLALWGITFALLLAIWGMQHSLTQMGWFFTKAALLTFGGAYAVLPYVVQGAVEQHAWLSMPQIMAGLALGESTPGPLIMIVAFVGYVGQALQAQASGASPFLMGALGACVVTWFTFLPSFIFILAGGPFVESTRQKLAFTAPLAGISACVVGVIATLALLFVKHAVWPVGQFDWQAAVLCLACGAALIRYQVGVVKVLAAAGLAGMLLRFFSA